MPPTSAPAGTSPLDGVHELAGLVIGAAEQLRARFEGTAAGFALTPAQARALLALRTGTPMRDLAEGLHCDASNVTGLVDRLETRDLVRREAAPGDRRVKRLVLTREGERLRVQLEAALVDTSPLITGLSDVERGTLRHLLGKVLAASGADERC